MLSNCISYQQIHIGRGSPFVIVCYQGWINHKSLYFQQKGHLRMWNWQLQLRHQLQNKIQKLELSTISFSHSQLNLSRAKPIFFPHKFAEMYARFTVIPPSCSRGSMLTGDKWTEGWMFAYHYNQYTVVGAEPAGDYRGSVDPCFCTLCCEAI